MSFLGRMLQNRGQSSHRHCVFLLSKIQARTLHINIYINIIKQSSLHCSISRDNGESIFYTLQDIFSYSINTASLWLAISYASKITTNTKSSQALFPENSLTKMAWFRSHTFHKTEFVHLPLAGKTSLKTENFIIKRPWHVEIPKWIVSFFTTTFRCFSGEKIA